MLLLATSCDHADDPAKRPPEPSPPEGIEAASEEGVHLGVPPATIRRARAEASGLSRMPPGLRAQALARGREREAPSYAVLRADPSAHEGARVSYDGHVGLVRPAGPSLTIIALQTRRAGDRWTDPLYVLSVDDPGLPSDGGASVRIDGWVVGERTIGRHALPLVVAFHVERLDADQ